MGLITLLEPQKKNPQRFNVHLDNQFAFGISAELAFEERLKVGMKLTEKEVEGLVEKDQVRRLVEKAVRFLGYRPRSEKELRDYFLYRGKIRDLTSEEERGKYLTSVEAAIEKVKKLGYLNDKEFAGWWTSQREEFKKSSARQLKLELMKKGISKELIEETLSTGMSEEEKALAIATKKARFLSALPKKEFKIKMGQFLARKGFDWELIKKIVDRLS